MSDFVPGLEGVIAFETAIAEPDRDGGSLRYRGVDIEELVGQTSFGDVWGLLVDNSFTPGLPPFNNLVLPVHSGDVRVDVQAGLATLAPQLGFKPILDLTDTQVRDELAQTSVTALSYVAQSARGAASPVPQNEVDKGTTAVEQFLLQWRGEVDPLQANGLNASTFTARVVASTGADVAAALSAAIGAMSGPLHGGAPTRVLHMVEDVEKSGDAVGYVKGILDRHERLMGFGHRVYRAEDPRARVLRRVAQELGSPRFEAASALEQAALSELRTRRPDRPIETNVEFWAALILDLAAVPAPMFAAMFTCARVAGWSAHVLEEKRTGRLIRPSARYIGPSTRHASSVEGWDAAHHF